MALVVFIDSDDTPFGESAGADAELIVATRGGDAAAYGQLYLRHVEAATRLSRILTRDRATADDLVSETFERVLAALRAGKGPDIAFRAYLLTTMRNSFYGRARRDGRVEFTDDMSEHDAGETFDDPAIAEQERHFAARAFKRLPERWQMILWHTEVEGDTPAQIAKQLGLTPNGVSALAYRARERLKEYYLREHITETSSQICEWTADRLGAKVRGGLSTRDKAKVDNHLVSCSLCKFHYMELAEVNSGIGVIIAPLLLGMSAPAYLGLSAVKWGIIGLWFGGLVDGVRSGAEAVGRFFANLGGRNVAIAGGGTAVIAAVLALVLLVDDAVEPSADAAPSTETTVEDSTGDPADPDDPANDPSDPDDPANDPDNPDDPDSEPEPEPSEYAIEIDPAGIGLTAGSDGRLPITLSAPAADGRAPMAPGRVTTVERALATPRVAPSTITLTLDFPDGITSPGGDATDGWNCTGTTTVTCKRAALRPGQSTTANLPIDVAPSVTGYQEIAARVGSGGVTRTATLRFPVSPPSTSTAFASLDATGVTATGNTFLTCNLQPLCGHPLNDNHYAKMTPYRDKAAPTSKKDVAVSGATLSVPSGSTVLWAGLYWTTSDYSTPSSVRLSTGGEWSTVSAQRSWDGYTRPARQSAATVTGLIGGSTTVWVEADADDLPTGRGQHAGWSLTVVYREPGAPATETAVYEGLAQQGEGGRLTVAIPSGDVDVAYTLWDGDKTLRGDTMSVGGSPVCQGTNIGASRSPGALEGWLWHTFGVDVDVCRARVGSGPTSLTIDAGSDPLEIGVLAVSSLIS